MIDQPNPHKRADEIRDVMFARFSELLSTMQNYFLLYNSATHVPEQEKPKSAEQQIEHTKALFDVLSEALKRTEDAIGYQLTADQIISRIKKNIEDDMDELIKEEKSSTQKSSGRMH